MIEYGEYKGKKMIILKKTEYDEFPFQFGRAKAKLIVDNFDAVRDFADEVEK